MQRPEEGRDRGQEAGGPPQSGPAHHGRVEAGQDPSCHAWDELLDMSDIKAMNNDPLNLTIIEKREACAGWLAKCSGMLQQAACSLSLDSSITTSSSSVQGPSSVFRYTRHTPQILE